MAQDSQITARDAAARLSVSLPTAYHLLNSLASEGLLTKESGQAYVLGPLAGTIADAVARDTRAPAHLRRALDALVAATGETAYISAWRAGEVRVLDIVEGDNLVRVTGLSVDYAKNHHARTSARVLLAMAEPEFREQQLSRMKLRRLTQHTITDRTALRRDLERIREQGIAIGRNEYALGLTCISAPVVEFGVATAALTIAMPSDRFDRSGSRVVRALRAAASAAGRRTST